MRRILHVDLDAFFCSVEELLNPELKGLPFAVGGSPEGRGVISSASYAARAYGVHSAMPTALALRTCPGLTVVSSHYSRYSEYSRQVMAILHDSAPIVEQLSIDEAFLDASDDRRSGEEIASVIKQRICDEVHLPTSWGIATSKLVAKIATEVGKPDGIITVSPGGEAAFLATLPVRMLWGVGPKTCARLEEEGVRTIGDLAEMSADRLGVLFGSHGLELASRAVGKDEREVVSRRTPKSLSSERTFSRDQSDGKVIRQTLMSLSEDVGRRLRQQSLAAKTIRLKIRWPDFRTQSRQIALEHATHVDSEIFEAAIALLSKVWKKGQPLRLLGVGTGDLCEPIRQLDMFDERWQQDERLLEALDAIRARYGHSAVHRGMKSAYRTDGQDREF
ncbi:MAG: DNA polymerase IV [Anaerolineales bacterium]|nr:DNA polymerase IV [Anaerolineales bacterium]